MMRKTTSALIGLALTASVMSSALAATTIDTGAPSGNGFSLALDSTDWLAGQISFNQASTIQSIKTYLDDNGNGAGSFTIALYLDSASHLPGDLLNSWSASGASGWNGVSNMNQAVAAGSYWVALEIQGSDTFSGLAPTGVATPLAKYAFNAGGYQGYQSMPDAFGLQVVAVPEPESYAMLLAGLGLIGFAARRRAH